MDDLPAIHALLDESSAAFAAHDFARFGNALEALLVQTHAATTAEGMFAFIEGLQGSIVLALVLRDPNEAARFLGLLEGRIRQIDDPDIRAVFAPAVTMARRDIEALHRGGRSRAKGLDLLFELFGHTVPPELRNAGPTHENVALILERASDQGDDTAALGTIVSIVVDRVVDDLFRAGDRGSLVAWLDLVEPFILQCDPDAVLTLIALWSSGYRNTALHGNAEHTFHDALDRTEALIAGATVPQHIDPATWEQAKDGFRRSLNLAADNDRALVIGTRREVSDTARRMLDSGFVCSDRLRAMLQQQVDGKVPASPPCAWDLSYNKHTLSTAFQCLAAERWEDAFDILARLAADHPERDADLAAGVPFAIAGCIPIAFAGLPGAMTAAIALLKEAVRQTECRRLEASGHARGVLDVISSDVATAPYRHLRHLLLEQGRIGEAIRVETLLAEQDHRLPVSLDQAWSDQAAERLPCFPDEKAFWARARSTAKGAKGRDWLARLLRDPPRLPLVQGRPSSPRTPLDLQPEEVHLAITVAGRRIAVVMRHASGQEDVVWIDSDPGTFNEAVLRLQLAIRQESPTVLAAADALGGILLGPLEPLLRAAAPQRLLIEPAGPVAHVPFPALRSDGAYLAERHEIVLQAGWHRPPAPTGGGIVSIGASGVGGDNALRWVEKDLVLVSAFAAATGLPIDSFGGPAAHPAAILDRLARQCRILHISSHFKAQLLNMAASAFLLDGGETLTVAELARCALGNCDLALLLGCETVSRPPAAPGSPIVGVDAVLVRLGVRSVVSSQWPVDDLASHLFLKAFLDALALPGTTKAQAVQRGQHAVMTSEHRYLAHPRHWAAFTLTGQP